jgi:hypothetical protein
MINRLQLLALGSIFAAVLQLGVLPQAFAQSDAQIDPASIVTRSVVVVEGDTMRSIARRELGKSGLSGQLATFNGMQEDDILAVGTILRIPLYTPVEEQFATVIFVKGEVSRNDEQVVRDDKIYLQDLLKTGNTGYATLQFTSGSVVSLQPKTHVKLEKLNCLETDDSCLIVMDAVQGEVKSDVNRRDGQPTEFTITTPYASAAVRGTEYEVNASSEAVIVGVTEGAVQVSASGAAVDLDEGFATKAVEGQPPSEPIALLPAPVYRYIPTRAAEGDEVLWWALSDALSYQANLTIDEEGKDVIVSANSENGILPITDVDAGAYFLRVRGIDENGIKGFQTPTKLVIAAIDSALTPVDTEILRRGSEFLVRVIDPPSDAAGYEIQVATNADFSDPLSVDVAETAAAIFRLEADKIYSRARILVDPEKVSAFGQVAESN